MTNNLHSTTGTPLPADNANASQLFQSVYDLESWLRADEPSSKRIVGNSHLMQSLQRQARQYATSNAPVLVTGESGTGKEGISRLIHQSSKRAAGPYVRVNCAALSEGLLESELFGHERGAFTGAISQHIGRFEWSNGGTLLLDEISEMPLALQAKLLRVLEESEFQRVGGNETMVVDVRIVATSNRILEQEVQRGNFRQDLYYRLNVLGLEMPSLREHPEDIPELVFHFLQLFRDEGEQPVTKVVHEAMNRLMEYRWPGNIRELRNVIHRASVLTNTSTITLENLPVNFQTPEPGTNSLPSTAEIMTLDEMEKSMILQSLKRAAGNKTAAARQLGITSRTLHNKLKRYEMDS